MRILWATPNFLHPTTKGGQIRTLEILKRLHARNEVHFVAFEDPTKPEGLARAGEYASYAYPIRHRVPKRRSAGFAAQLIPNLFSDLPLAITRYRSTAMRRKVDELLERHPFDSVVCDFLTVAQNFSDPAACVLFQHNVEFMIWRRHAETAGDPLRRLLYARQAERMRSYESQVCRSVRHVMAVSNVDAQRMAGEFRIESISTVPTGVDVDYFAAPPGPPTPKTVDFVFVGSMDWLANVDGVLWFANEVLPRIRERRSDVTLSIVGRDPGPAILDLARRIPGVRVTGTVADVRPHFWSARLCIVPLRVGGGTRLKIFEAMAAKAPVVSTPVGAEGLSVSDGDHIALADTPAEFANTCLRLLDQPAERDRLAASAFRLVKTECSWQTATDALERILFANSTRAWPSSSSSLARPAFST